MVRKTSRKDKAAKAKSSSTPSLNDRGRYQPLYKKPAASGPSSKAALKSKKTVDTTRCVCPHHAVDVRLRASSFMCGCPRSWPVRCTPPRSADFGVDPPSSL